jgi:RNA polymerase sigma factor (sigma-70 family)
MNPAADGTFPTDPSELEALFHGRAGWLVDLARQLVRDPHLAEDLAQDTWLAELRGKRPAGAPFGAWAAAVLRNGARGLRRGESRRRGREQDAARSDGAEPPDQVLAHMETCERVLAALRGVREPYRAVLVLRWLEGCSPREIARRLQRPVRTVQTQLHRGLELLRERLDRTVDGGRAAWMALLGPLLPATPPLLSWPLVAAAAVLLVLGLGALGSGPSAERTPDANPSTPAAAVLVPTPAAAEEPDLAPAHSNLGDRAVVEAESAPFRLDLSTLPGLSIPTRTLPGLVVDLAGQPVPEVELVACDFDGRPTEPSGVLATSGPDGRFELDVGHHAALVLTARSPRWTAVWRPIHWGADAQPAEGYVIVVAPAIELAGQVVGSDGEPVVGAFVSWVVDERERGRVGRSLESNLALAPRVITEPQGHFDLGAVAAVPGAELRIDAARHPVARLEAPQVTARDLRLAIGGPQPAALTLEGQVVDPSGAAVPGAHVALFQRGVPCDERGEFRLEIPPEALGAGAGAELIAVAPGRQPARLRCATGRPDELGAWPVRIRLVLSEPTRSIAGTIIDGDGQPLHGVQLELLDRELLGQFPFAYEGRWLELGETIESIAGRSAAEPPIEFDDVTVTEWDSGEPPPEATFALHGLQDRSYRLRAFDPESLAVVITEPIAAGTTGVLVQFPRAELWPPIGGVVVGYDDRPLPGADLQVEWIDPADGRARTGPQTAADADGRFHFPGLSRGARTLLVKAAGAAAWVRYALEPLAGATDLRLVVPRRVSLQVERVAPVDGREWLSLEDRSGARVWMVLTRGNLARGVQEVGLSDTGSEVLTTTEDAAFLVLRLGEQVTARVPIALAPGELTVIRP